MYQSFFIFAYVWFSIVTSDCLSFASVEIDKNYSSTLPQWKSLCHNKGLSPNNKGSQWRGSLVTRLRTMLW